MKCPSYMSSPSSTYSAMTHKVQVDNRISLRNYYRIADYLLKQASIYTQEKSLIDLYIILLRYSSLVLETIPYHRDYHALHKKEWASCKKKLLAALDELEELKPKVRCQLDELEKVKNATEVRQLEGADCNRTVLLSCSNKQMLPATSLKQNSGPARVSSSDSIDLQFHKSSFGLPLPKQEPFSMHSFLGPSGIRDQWLVPNAELKVNYQKNAVADVSEITSLDQVGQPDTIAEKENDLKLEKSRMKSFLSLGIDSSWLAEESDFPLVNRRENKEIKFDNLVQLSPPPVMAQMQKEILPVSHLIADPRPGPPKDIQHVVTGSNSYLDLHIPVMMMEEFLRVARENTAKNLETCGVLTGFLRNRVFYITTLIIPKQESTSDSCQTLNEEEIFEVQDSRSLFQLGWIHTHPTQTCFMSSVDLHTHYAYQVMLPEAIAIVMAPTDELSPHGIFQLSNPSGVSVIRNCQQRGFHPHEKTKDGSPLYEHCSHVYMNANLNFDVVDLRRV